MSYTIRIAEDQPPRWPTNAGSNDAEAWERIESYIARRWAARSITYIAAGPGAWEPDLSPTTITTAEVWQDGAWTSVTLDATPLGGVILPSEETYRLTGTVGDDARLPPAVSEAHRRLSRYFSAIEAESTMTGIFSDLKRTESKTMVPPHIPQGATSMVDNLSEASGRSASWKARALQYSGAADLLRPYRRLGS